MMLIKIGMGQTYNIFERHQTAAPNTDGWGKKLVTLFARPTVWSYGRAFPDCLRQAGRATPSLQICYRD